MCARHGPLAPAALILTLTLAHAQQDPKTVRVSLEDGSGAARWGAAEATVQVSPEHAQRGGTSLHFHVAVDHHAGEPEYPIGWPRTSLDVPAELQDWSAYDFLELVIHAETSRDSLPPQPLGFIAYTPDRQRLYHRPLTQLRKGQTTTIVIPLSQIPRHNHVPRLQFFISESDYKHGDTVDFYIDDVALVRYAGPTLSEVAPVQAIAYDDAKHLGVRFRLLGLREGDGATVTARVRQEGRLLGEARWQLGRGEHEAWVALDRPPRPGEAHLELLIAEPQWLGKLRIVPGPYAQAGGD